MSQWGNTDDAANSVIWAAGNLNKTPNTANRDALFGNTTADAFVTGETVGMYGVDANEAKAARAGAGDKVSSPGWQLRREGSGGRAGRVQIETLVALSGVTAMGGVDAEDVVFEDAFISIILQPASATANATSDEQAVFTVGAETSSGTLTYQWYYTTDPGNTASFAIVSTGFSGGTTASLTADANTVSDGTLVRCVVSSTGADSANTDDATLTITT